MTDKPFQLDKKELLKDAPGAVKLFAGPGIDWINKFDADKDGVPEIAKYAPLFFKVLPIFTALAPLVDWEKALTLLLDHCSKDRAQAERLVERILETVGVAVGQGKDE